MLWFTKVASASTETGVDVGIRSDGTQVPEFGDYVDYVLETTPEKEYFNHPQDKYQQFRFDSRNLNYYIDDDGEYWRTMTFIPDAVTYDVVQNLEHA